MKIKNKQNHWNQPEQNRTEQMFFSMFFLRLFSFQDFNLDKSYSGYQKKPPTTQGFFPYAQCPVASITFLAMVDNVRPM